MSHLPVLGGYEGPGEDDDDSGAEGLEGAPLVLQALACRDISVGTVEWY